MDFELALRTVTRRLESERIRFAVIGGLAVHAWGRTRPTRDADFAVDLSNQTAVLGFMRELGYRPEYVSEAFSNHMHDDPRFGHVDFMYVSGSTADTIFENVSLKPLLAEGDLPVASPEHLAMMKAAAMKNFPHRALYEAEDVRVLLAVPARPCANTSTGRVCWISLMRSTKRAEPLDHFESDVRITPQDSAAQWRIRNARPISTADYLAWCSWLSRQPAPPEYDLHSEPFEL